MKKILVIHNKYRLQGGEDIAVENELLLLKKEYKVKELFFDNNKSNLFQIFLGLLLNKNIKSMSILKKTLSEFNPDVAYVHNTWFLASTGIFKVLEKNKVKTIVKLHNFRYFCTRTQFLRKHLGEKQFCEACGHSSKKWSFFNKYFNDSYLKSFFVNRYGKKYFNILKTNELKIIVLTKFHKNFLVNLGIGQDKISVANNYIEEKRPKTNINKKNQIVYAGRVSKEKGVMELIESFNSSLLEDYKLLIIGDGPELIYLKNKFESNDIKFLGKIDNTEVLKTILESIAVVTSTKLFEGQPTLLCEAASLGVPSIFPKTGGIEEFFPKDYKLGFKQFDYVDLKNKLELLRNKEFYQKAGEESKHFYESKYNYKILSDKFEKIINEL